MGKRVFSSFKKHLPNHRMTMAFEVGASGGDTTAALLEFYPSSHVCAFEAVQATFDVFKARFIDHSNVTANRLALSAHCDVGAVTASGTSPNNSLVLGPDAKGKQTEAVEMLTGDAYCERNAISHISYLNIDTSGNDMDVLRGFHRMIGSQQIDIIQLEASMSAHSRRGVAFDVFRGYLNACDYSLFGFYNQTRDGKGSPILRRSSVVFLSRETVEENTLRKSSPAKSGEDPDR